MSKPIISNNQNLINLKTKGVSGVNVMEPEDFVYVGSFGSGTMINFLEENDKYLRLKSLIKSNFESMVKRQNQLLQLS